MLHVFSYIADHEMHDGLRYEVTDALVYNSHVGVHQVTDGFHFTLQLRVHGEVIWGAGRLTLNLQMTREEKFVLNINKESTSQFNTRK